MKQKELCVKCQGEIVSTTSRWAKKTRKFCSDKCRAAYHNSFIVRLPESVKPEQRAEVENLVAQIEKSNKAVKFVPQPRAQ